MINTHLCVIRFDSMFNQWESMAAMPEAVLHPAVAATNQRIYVFGGEDAMQNPVRLIQVSCGGLHKLQFGFPFFHPSSFGHSLRPAHVMAAPLPFVQVYHIARNMWSKMENRSVKNVSAPAAIIDDKIYIIGGKQPQENVEGRGSFPLESSQSLVKSDCV